MFRKIVNYIQSFISFLRSSISELRQVEYLSKSDTYFYSIVVFVMLFVFSTVFLFVDKLVAVLVAWFIK